MDLAYVDGRMVPIDQASVSIEDRGMQFADGVYEVVRAYRGRLFRLGPHLVRMRQGLGELEIPEPEVAGGLGGLLEQLWKASGEEQGLLYVQVTRGRGARAHVPPAGMRPTLVVTCRGVPPHAEQRYREGVKVIVHRDVRWEWCHLKTTALVANVVLRTQAQRAGAYECLLHREGLVTEATAANVFAVIDGVLRTAPRSNQILAGVTRAAVLELAAKLGLPHAESPFSLAEAARAEELFVTGTHTEIMPVVDLDGQAVGGGRPGPVTTRLLRAYRDLVEAEVT
ncbi:MAG TPA: aminotransferase class IV [Bacillota bacterium]|nr:aminotransferase class IV [Bacillota bacterium]